MRDLAKSKKQLAEELRALRERLAERDRKTAAEKPVFAVVDALFRGVLEDLRQAIYRLNHQTNRMEYVSTSIRAVLGVTAKAAAEMTEEEMLLRIHPEDVGKVRQAQEEHRKRLRDDPNALGVSECRWRKGNEYVWIRNRFLFVLDKQGNKIVETGIIEDFTDRKQAEEKLRKAERDRKTVLDSVSELVVYHDLNMDIIWANRATEESLGLSQEEIVGKKCYQLWQQRNRPCEGCPVQSAIETQQSGEAEIETLDGRIWRVCGYPSFDADGTMIGVTEVVTDITARRRAELSLREAHDKLEQRVTERTADLQAANQRLREAHLQLLNAREEERRNLAAELHDSLAQDLVVLQLVLQCGLSALASANVPQEWLTEAGSMCSRMIREIRQLSHGLYPPMLETLGLLRSLRSLIEPYHVANRTIDIRWHCDSEDRRFAREIEITLFRIAQESLSNAVRHGNADQIEILVEQAEGTLMMEVTDNGEGFDPDDETKMGLGMRNMQDRLDLVDGRLHVTSQPGRTCLRVELPLA